MHENIVCWPSVPTPRQLHIPCNIWTNWGSRRDAHPLSYSQSVSRICVKGSLGKQGLREGKRTFVRSHGQLMMDQWWSRHLTLDSSLVTGETQQVSVHLGGRHRGLLPASWESEASLESLGLFPAHTQKACKQDPTVGPERG